MTCFLCKGDLEKNNHHIYDRISQLLYHYQKCSLYKMHAMW